MAKDYSVTRGIYGTAKARTLGECFRAIFDGSGLFQLLSSERPAPILPKIDPDGTTHDDFRFYSLFGKAKCAELPMTALHRGQTWVNWNGREEDVTVHSQARPQAAPEDAWAVNDPALS